MTYYDMIIAVLIACCIIGVMTALFMFALKRATDKHINALNKHQEFMANEANEIKLEVEEYLKQNEDKERIGSDYNGRN